MTEEWGGLARYLLGEAAEESEAACPAALKECRLLRQEQELVLWASVFFVNPGPEPASFAGSCLAQAFQSGLALRPALVRGQPGFQGEAGLRPLPPSQGAAVHLAWALRGPAANVEISLRALFPLPGQNWSARFLVGRRVGTARQPYSVSGRPDGRTPCRDGPTAVLRLSWADK